MPSLVMSSLVTGVVAVTWPLHPQWSCKNRWQQQCGWDEHTCLRQPQCVQLILESSREVLVRQSLARFFLHIAGQVNETGQHIVLIASPTLTTTTLVPLGYLLPAPSTKLAVVVKASVTLYTLPRMLSDREGSSAKATEPAGL